MLVKIDTNQLIKKYFLKKGESKQNFAQGS